MTDQRATGPYRDVSEWVHDLVTDMARERAAALDAVIADAVAGGVKVVLVSVEQRVDEEWLAGRPLIRSPHVPYGAAYEVDPAYLALYPAMKGST